MDIPFWQLVLVGVLAAFLGRLLSRLKRNEKRKDNSEN